MVSRAAGYVLPSAPSPLRIGPLRRHEKQCAACSRSFSFSTVLASGGASFDELVRIEARARGWYTHVALSGQLVCVCEPCHKEVPCPSSTVVSKK